MHVFNVSSRKQQALYCDGQQTTFLLNDLHVCEHVRMIKRRGCELAPSEPPVQIRQFLPYCAIISPLCLPPALALLVSLSTDTYKTPPVVLLQAAKTRGCWRSEPSTGSKGETHRRKGGSSTAAAQRQRERQMRNFRLKTHKGH